MTKSSRTMRPDTVSEAITLSIEEGKSTRNSYVSNCDFKSPSKSKQLVELVPKYVPEQFRDALICYKDSTRKRYVSCINYSSRMKLSRVEETSYIWPHESVNSFISHLRYAPDQRNFKTAVYYVSPRTGSPSDDVNNNTLDIARRREFSRLRIHLIDGRIGEILKEDNEELHGEQISPLSNGHGGRLRSDGDLGSEEENESPLIKNVKTSYFIYDPPRSSDDSESSSSESLDMNIECQDEHNDYHTGLFKIQGKQNTADVQL